MAPVLARHMAAVGVVVAAVLLGCCSLAQGAPERAPANRLEVTSELPAGLSWPSGGRLLLEPSGGKGVWGLVRGAHGVPGPDPTPRSCSTAILGLLRASPWR